VKQTVQQTQRAKPQHLLGTLGSWGLSALLLACSSASGTVEVTAYGEEFIEEGIPAAEVDDGWNITFSRFEVTLAEVMVGGAVLGAIGVGSGTPDQDVAVAEAGRDALLAAIAGAGG